MNTEQPKRTQFRTTRFTVEEAAEVDEHAVAVRISTSALIRSRVLGRPLPKGLVPALNVQAWRELAPTRSNINQLAHHFNLAAQSGEPPPGVVQVLEVLRTLEIDVKTLRLQLLGAA
jgi:hypothetical protein